MQYIWMQKMKNKIVHDGVELTNRARVLTSEEVVKLIHLALREKQSAAEYRHRKAYKYWAAMVEDTMSQFRKWL